MRLNTACQHPKTKHRHGTVACYVRDQCRCKPCRRARSLYDANYTRPAVKGLGPYWQPRSPEWLSELRKGLLEAVEASR